MKALALIRLTDKTFHKFFHVRSQADRKKHLKV
jgi:hypothetical protein